MTFSRDAKGKITGLALHYHGQTFTYDKISNVPPKAPEPVKPPVIVKLDTNVLEACVGRYEVAPDAVFPTGMKLTVWREGEQLVGQVRGADTLRGMFDLFPESETNFFIKINGAQLTFIKNDKGEVTTVTHHETGVPDIKGRKVSPAVN